MGRCLATESVISPCPSARFRVYIGFKVALGFQVEVLDAWKAKCPSASILDLDVVMLASER